MNQFIKNFKKREELNFLLNHKIYKKKQEKVN